MASTNFYTLKDIYPQSNDALLFELKKIEQIKENALIILDTNVLLLPYKTNSESLIAIKELYNQLITDNKLYVPSHVIREFLKNRPDKISEIYEALNKKSTASFQYVDNYPVLTNLEEYSQLIELGKQLRLHIKEYQNKIRGIMSIMQDWTWDDPVSFVYKELFVNRILDDSHIDLNELEKELSKRNTLSQPPGFKDKSKDLNASGDLIVWLEILKCAQTLDKDVIFVSADEKNDWWHQSGGKSLYPRFELIDEFRRKTNGKSFHIVSLSKLLSLFEVNIDVVKSVEETEKQIIESKEDVEDEYDDYVLYRRTLDIPKNHKIEVIDDGRKVKNRLDTDIYLINEFDVHGALLKRYRLYDSTRMDPPFNRLLDFEQLSK